LFDADAGSKFNNGPAVFFDIPTRTMFLVGPDYSALTEGEEFELFYNVESIPTSAYYTALNHFGTDSYSHVPYIDRGIYDSFGSNVRKTCGPTSSEIDWRDPMIYNVTSAPSDWEVRLNGASFYNTSTNTVAFTSSPKIGTTDPPASGFGQNGRVAAHILYDGKLSSGDRTAVYNALDAMRTV
jgi:hypothetical protein